LYRRGTPLTSHIQWEWDMHHRLKDVRQRYGDALTRVSWQDFERLLAAHYTTQGYRVEHVGTAGSGARFDGGIDFKLRRDDQYLVVQCKHWNARQVPHNPVHELLGVMLTEGATGAIVVTSGEFTEAARVAALKQPCIQLIDGAALRQMLGPLPAQPALTSRDATFFDGDVGRRERMVLASDYRSHPARRSNRTNPLVRLAVAIIAGLVAFYLIRHALSDFKDGIVAPQSSSVRTAPRSVEPRSLPSAQFIAAPDATSSQQPPTAVHYEQQNMSQEELREWKRRNAEAMKILEKTTPELER
jgi:restriction system protein